MTIEFTPWPKIARLNRDIVITEKIDGTNAAIGVIPFTVPCSCDEPGCENVIVVEDVPPTVYAQSRSRIITPEDDNFGFARFVSDNADALASLLGPGVHFGEWWGQGIQRGYGLDHKRFSLFNRARWGFLDDPDYLATQPRPIVGVVPLLYEGSFDGWADGKLDPVEDGTPWNWALYRLRGHGSYAAPGFMKPEGIVVYHTAANQMFKVTIEGDEKPKGSRA